MHVRVGGVHKKRRRATAFVVLVFAIMGISRPRHPQFRAVIRKKACEWILDSTPSLGVWILSTTPSSVGAAHICMFFPASEQDRSLPSQ
eukprot:scaffold1912_cov167-Amphora_coffeaeformis.AAC.19